MKPRRPRLSARARLHLPVTVGLGLSLTMPPLMAGDILRGGSARAPVQQTDAATAAALAVQQQLKATQQDSLAKTTQSLNALRALQAQARALASQNNAGINPNLLTQTLPNVPNGLGTGALQIRGIPTGALAPVQSQSGSTTNVIVKQTAQQALLDWETFNVGRDTHLQFDQSAGGSAVSQWIAFNRISDPSGQPSQILGKISAPGQVFIINQNGIIFGGASQVNTRSLVASSLPLNDNLVQRGLLNNPDSQFLFSALPINAGIKGTPAFTPADSVLPDNRRGDVTVQAGAQLSSPVSADGNGGRILLAAPNVTNAGSLLAPSGQVILAGGLQLGVVAHATSDASLRGLDVYVGSTGTDAGTVTNSGIIEVTRGSVSLSGRRVNNTGAIESTTSVSLNGRIDLTANYDAAPNAVYDPNNPSTGKPFLFRSTGEVNLGTGSLLRILPEYDSTSLVTGTELALRSQVNLQGQTIHLGRDSTILAPNALASLSAGTWAYNTAQNPPLSAFHASGGQVYFDVNANVNVAGSAGIAAPLSRVILSLVLRAGELSPSPLQRDGFLRGRRVTVDLRDSGTYEGREWIGTPLAELRGYAGLVERTVGELTVTGGSVDISAGGSVVMQQGSSVNVSGGYVDYQGGDVQTTQLWVGGNLVDIRDATPDRVYSGILSGTYDHDHDRWGVRNTYTQPLSPDGGRVETSSAQGGDAGRIAISAPGMALDGQLTGLVAPGPRQLRSSATSSAMPRAGQLALSFTGEEILNNAVVQTYPTPPDITFSNFEQQAADAFALDAAGNPLALSEDRRRRVFLSPQLTTTRGFGSITLHNEGGDISVPESVSLIGKPGGAFRFHGSNISIFGNVSAPGGTLVFEALNFTPYEVEVIKALPEEQRLLPAPNAGRGVFTLGPAANLNAAGWLVDDRFSAPAPFARPARFAGGSVTIEGYTANLAAGGRVDVSGSALIEPDGTVHYGNGGSITINGGMDPQLDGVVGGRLNLGATLAGLSGSKGGSLAVQAPLVQIGGTTPRADTLLVTPEFFRTGGFTQFTLTGLGAEEAGTTLPAVSIAPGTVIQPQTKTLLVEPLAENGGVATRTLDLPVGLRAPVGVSLIAAGIQDGIANAQLVRGDVVSGGGSLIQVDPRASVTLTGKTITALGSITAPGGTISLSASTKSVDSFPSSTEPVTTLYAGPESRFSTAGTTVQLPDPFGRRIGTVLDGGTISLQGNLFAAAGARLDVSGASDELDISPSVARPLQAVRVPDNSGTTSGPDSLAVERVRVDSDGGLINLRGGEFLLSDATLKAQAGGSTALGGTLRVSSGRYYPPGTISIPPSDFNLAVRQSGGVIPAGLNATAGQPIAGITGRGYFTADAFNAGGFDSLKLGGTVEFQGAVTISARGALQVSDGGVLGASGLVGLAAPYVSLGTALALPTRPDERLNPLGSNLAPSFGGGELNVTAGNIDLGTLSLLTTGRATLSASTGDIRGSGVFSIAGDLTLRAGQIYPLTATPLEFFAYDYVDGTARQGSITVQAGTTRQVPLSAGGSLGLFASRIEQRGTLRAPFGSIQLGWDGVGTAPRNLVAGSDAVTPVTARLVLGEGSVTAVSGVDPLTGKGITIPYGISPDGLSWIDPRGVDITAGGLPEKSIALQGASVTTAPGATLDLRGGGDLFAYRWVEGNGGPDDILASPGSFAILPGFQSNIAPVAPYNSSAASTNLIADYGSGYVNTSLRAGDQIFVQGSKTLAAGIYTLLPARYALLPGAVLVTPRSESATGTYELPDGSSLVSGYEFNSLNTTRTQPTLASQFELASGNVIRQRAQYDTQLANTFLNTAAARLNLDAPLLPKDSGSLAFQTTQSLNLLGSVLSPSISNGRGARIDLSSALDFLINRTGETALPGTVALSSGTLQSWGAESLVIGGTRIIDAAGGTVLNVTSPNVTVDNAGAPLAAANLTLAALNSIRLADGAQLVSTGGSIAAEDYQVAGNGALLRVSADAGATVTRRNVTASTASLTVGSGVQITGGGITLDSSATTTLSPTAALSARSYAINSGRISLVFDQPGSPTDLPGLVLTGPLLDKLQSGTALSLSSYSTLDIYGTGTLGGSGLARLTLNAGEVLGQTAGGSDVTFAAQRIEIGNAAGAAGSLAAPASISGSLALQGNTIHLTGGDVAVNQFGTVRLASSGGVIGEGAGRFGAQSALEIQTPLLTGAAGSNRRITAGGVLALNSTGGAATVTPGLGATLQLSGAQPTVNSNVRLPSGSFSVTATTGTLQVNGPVNVGGVSQRFYDVTRYTDAGSITLTSTGGDVRLGSGALLNLAAVAGGGNAGSLGISAPAGAFVSGGSISAAGGNGGTFNLDTLTLPDTGALNTVLTAAGFTASQTIRVRSGDVIASDTAVARSYSLFADSGNLKVSGIINAGGAIGGKIHLAANGGLTVASGASLSVAAENFDNAGKGGQITLESGTQRGGVAGTGTLDLQSGATLDLSVAVNNAGSAARGQFTGKLHLRAPQNAAGNDLLANAIGSTIVDASSIVVEGYRIYDLTSTGGAITASVQTGIRNDGTSFLGAAGATTPAYTAMVNRLLADNASLAPVFVLAPGAEILNRSGDLTLGTASSTTLNDWDLSTYRFGPKSAPGVLTLRASGNLVFNNTLSDGFTPFAPANNPPAANLRLWQGRLTAQNPLLPVNTQSYSYRLTAGGDLTSSSYAATTGTAGTVRLGKAGTTQNERSNTVTGGNNADIRTVVPQRWQVIRTGSGDINIHAAGSIQLLNQLTAIYTAGTAVADITMGGTFDQPRPGQPTTNPGLGAAQLTSIYPAQYSSGGGNVALLAGGNIEHVTRDASGALVADSQLQLPNNWLYRRGTVDSATGQFGIGRANGEVLSTSWWVDFNNFYQGVGALGGGNVLLTAAGAISNVDAVAPTNLRVTKGTSENPLAANQSAFELGGGDVTVRAGGNLDGGVYYVERGRGRLSAGGSILTNTTRSVLAPSSVAAGQTSALTELPTTLFAGRASFDVSARGNVLLGPVANPFLLPQGLGNSVWYKSFFSTFGAQTNVNVSSLGGDVTLRSEARPFGEGAAVSDPLLSLWALNKQFLGPNSASLTKPWLRLNDLPAENNRLRTLYQLQPGTMNVSAYSGSINLTGGFTLSPSETGSLSMLAAAAINALQPTGTVNFNGLRTTWGTSLINLSDAKPLALPGVFNPLGYTNAQAQAVTTRQPDFFLGIDALFAETGSSDGVLQTKQALHAAGLLHVNDTEPVRLYAGSGDISGLTLFSSKAARIFAGRDLTDTSLYIQHVRSTDVSVVTSGRDIIPANSSAPLRVEANRTSNLLHTDSGPLAGDIQISGPGTLQVLAGRTLDLGTVSGNADGTGVGLTSIGNARNPFLPFEGAHLIAGAGIGTSTGLASSTLNFDGFIASHVLTPKGVDHLKELAPQLGGRTFQELTADDQKRIALEIFYLVLRDAGRQHIKTPDDEYVTGFEAIASLFPAAASGEIFTRSRDIRTRTGGNISLFAPGGGVTLASTKIGNPLTPPGILTESGGNISVFTRNDISFGIGRIFTLRGGNEILWSSKGNIAAGSSARTVKSAPPTRVLVDPQSGSVQTDLAGLATGGGIGVLATVAGVKPGDVDLIAPEGFVDAGDAGIRATGNLTIAAVQIINAGNISVGGTSSGTPAPVAPPNVGGLTSASNSAAAASNAASTTAKPAGSIIDPASEQLLPSLYSVEVLGYGGEDPKEESEEQRRKREGGDV